jgi:hypothetical protein
MEQENKTIADMIRVTATNQNEFLTKLADHVERLELENANLKLELKKWSVTLESQNISQ